MKRSNIFELVRDAMVLLFGLCSLLLLIAAPVIVLRFGMQAEGKQEPEEIKPELDQPEQKP